MSEQLAQPPLASGRATGLASKIVRPWILIRRGSTPDVRGWASALTVLAIGLTVLLGTTADFRFFRLAAGFLLLAWILLNLPVMARVERLFLAAAAAISITALAFPSPPTVLASAAERASLFLVFVFALGFLREAARTSRAATRCGKFIISRRPGLRYLTLSAGGHLVSILLNIGALSLLGSMIASANTLSAANGNLDLQARRLRQMSAALFRGFTTIVLWSPVGAGIPITLALLPSLTWLELAPWGLGLMVTFIVAGWLLDRLSPASAESVAGSPAATGPSNILPLLGITAGIVAAVILTDAVLTVELFVAVVGVAPLASLIWLAAQYWRAGPGLASVAVGRRTSRYLVDGLPTLRVDAVIMASLGYASVLIVALASVAPTSEYLAQLTLHPVAVALAIPLVMALLGQVGINPVVSAIVICSALGQLERGPLSPLVLALVVQGGWSISLATTPYSGSGLILSRAIGTSSRMLASWNRLYAFVCYVLLSLLSLALVWGSF